MDITERARAWTYDVQCLRNPARSLAQALERVVAVYATHPTAPLALKNRSSFSSARYRALDKRRKALRIRAMRQTTFLVPAQNAARIFTATKASDARARQPLKRTRLSDSQARRVKSKILKAATTPIGSRELGEISALHGSQLSALLSSMRYEGTLLILAGASMNMSPHRYVATETWWPQGLDSGDVDAALSWLARAYLSGYGPARVEDFVWWAGVGKRAGAKAMETVDRIEVDGGLLLAKKHERAFATVTRMKNEVVLLPRWDSYTMGHAPDGRERFVHPDVQKRVYTPIGVGLPGDGNPVVLVDGQAVATWTFSAKDGAEVQPFEKLTPRVKKRVDAELEGIAGFLSG